MFLSTQLTVLHENIISLCLGLNCSLSTLKSPTLYFIVMLLLSHVYSCLGDGLYHDLQVSQFCIPYAFSESTLLRLPWLILPCLLPKFPYLLLSPHSVTYSKGDNTTGCYYIDYYVYLDMHEIICFMYNIYSTYTDVLCVDDMILDACPCMLLAIHCMYFYWVIVHTIVLLQILNASI